MRNAARMEETKKAEKEMYVKPITEIIYFETEDVITASDDTDIDPF